MPAGDHGYGHSPEQVGQVRASAELLAGYYDEVSARTATYLSALGPTTSTSWSTSGGTLR